MKRRSARYILVAVVACVVIVLLWYGSTALLLGQWAGELARSAGRHGASSMFISSGDKTRFILWFNGRSRSYLHRAIDSPDATSRGKIHCAWILANVGDTSRFDVFHRGLQSGNGATRYIAAVRMWDFPDESFRYPHELVAAASVDQHEVFWGHFALHAEELPLSSESVAELKHLLGDGFRSEPMSDQEQQKLKGILTRFTQ